MRELKKAYSHGYCDIREITHTRITYENHGEDPLTLQVKQFNFLKFVTWGRYSKVIKRWAGQSAVQYPAGAREFLFSTISASTLGPTQPPIQWILWALPRE